MWYVNNKMATLFMGKIYTQSFLNDLKSFKLSLRNCVSLTPHPHYIFFNSDFRNEDEKAQIITNMRVIENFINGEEENSFLNELEPHLKRIRYERDHWDNAIKGYRELEKIKWNPVNLKIIERVKNIAFNKNSVPLKHVHVLDLEENGVIMPHIDSIKFCGTTIAGISLLSDSVMRLVNEKHKDKVVDILLKRYSLYIMTGTARYDFTHEILGNENSKFNNQTVKKNRRISIICRNEP